MKVGVAPPILAWLWGQQDCLQSNRVMGEGKIGGESD